MNRWVGQFVIDEVKPMPEALRCTLQYGRDYIWVTNGQGGMALDLTDAGMAALAAAGFTRRQMIDIQPCHVGGELMPWIVVTPVGATAN